MTHEFAGAIETVKDVVEIVDEWEERFFDPGMGFPFIWYRGHGDATWELQPTALREWFRAAAESGESIRDSGLPPPIQLEMTINKQFRRMAGSVVPAASSLAGIYLLAQHHGLPTRLLDWTTNPLAALFFAVSAEEGADGTLLAMNPRELTPWATENQPDGLPYPKEPKRGDHPFLEMVCQFLFGSAPMDGLPQCILPVIPDWSSPRMLQQNACFTFHVPGPEIQTIPADYVRKYVIPHENKSVICRQLRRVSVNWATLFPDADHIAREIRTAWGLFPEMPTGKGRPKEDGAGDQPERGAKP